MRPRRGWPSRRWPGPTGRWPGDSAGHAGKGERTGAGTRGDLVGGQGGHRVGRPFLERCVEGREAEGHERLNDQRRRVGVGGLGRADAIRVEGPAAVGDLTGCEEELGTGRDVGRDRTLGRHPLEGEGRRVGVRPGEGGRSSGAGVVGVVRRGPTPVRALLGGEPGDGGVHRRRARHTGAGQCGQGQTLLIAAGVIVGGLGLGAEQAGVGTRRLLGGQEPGHQVGAAECVGILTQGMGIQDEQGQLSGSIHSSRGGVGVDVVGQVAQGGVGVTRIRAGRGHGQHGVGRSREVGRSRRRGGRDVATGRQLTGQPVRASLSRGRLRGRRRWPRARRWWRWPSPVPAATEISRPTASTAGARRRLMDMG